MQFYCRLMWGFFNLPNWLNFQVKQPGLPHWLCGIIVCRRVFRILSKILDGDFCKNGWRVKVVNYFRNELHLLHLTVFWKRLWFVSLGHCKMTCFRKLLSPVYELLPPRIFSNVHVRNTESLRHRVGNNPSSNIRLLRRDENDDDENGTWNGNSTQQM